MDNQYQDPNQSQGGTGQPQYTQNNYQPGYQPNNYMRNEDDEVMTTGQWLLMLLIFMIPCVNIIMMFVWAFSSEGNKNRKNFCRANLIMSLIYTVIGVVFFVTIFAGIMNSYYYW